MADETVGEPEQIEVAPATGVAGHPEVTDAADQEAAARPVSLADPVLLVAVEFARAALAEVTTAESIGDVIGHQVEGDHVLSLLFESKLAGYPDWHWAATLARVSDDDEPTVLEVELLPGDGSILSPAWVPWADRLTADAIIDDSESEFDDDDDDGEPGDDAEGARDGDDSDDDADEDEDEDEDEDDEDDEIDESEAAARALRRDRDGIDIDTIAEEGLDIDGLDDGELEAGRLVESREDTAELIEDSLVVDGDLDRAGLETGDDEEVDRTY